MGAGKKKRQPTITAIGKERTRTCPTKSGLAQKITSVDASEACLHGKSPNFPDAEMIDADSASSTYPEPENTRIAEHAQQPSGSKKGKEIAREELSRPADLSAPKIAVPYNYSTAAMSVSGAPPELMAVAEADRQRSNRNYTRISICSTAIHGVEETLSPLAKDEFQGFVDSLKAHLRVTIANFLETAQETTPAVMPAVPARPAVSLPPRPAVPLPVRPVIAPPPRPMEKRMLIPAAPKAQASKTSWATVAKKGLENNPGPTTTKAASPPKPKQKVTSTVDKRLFVRLERDSEWRSLSLCGAQIAVADSLNCSKDNIKSIQRVKTGFAITAKDDETRQKLLEKADGGIEIFKLEQASNLVALRIATVPVAIKYSTGVVSTTAQMVADEIFRVTGKVPTQLRPHGVTKSGAKYQNWQALFTRESAPRPGFRLFYESGMASTFRPRRQIEQCKRCLGFHPTRGCSRAPACWNCGSTMHSAAECQAPTRCRNCGGPRRSDS